MGEYDAFGRKKGEDTMADLGWGATGEAPPSIEQPASPPVATTPTASATPSADWSPAQPASRAPSAARRKRNGRPIVWLIQLLVLGGLAAGIYFAVDSGKDAVDKVEDAFNTFTVGGSETAVPEDSEGSTPPKQVAPRRVLTAQGLSDSLKIMERDTPGVVTNLYIRPEYISYQVQRGKKFTIARLDPSAEAADVSTTQDREPTEGGIRYKQIDPGAPTRLIRGAGARLNKARNDVDYLVLQEISGVPRWIVYFKADSGRTRYAIGDAQGRVTQIY